MFNKKPKDASSIKRMTSSRNSKEYSKVPTKAILSDSSRSPSPSKRSTTTRRGSSASSISRLEEFSESDSDIDDRTGAEKELFRLVGDGDPELVQTYLKQNNAIDLDKSDVEGYSVLHKAVKNDNAEVVDILLSTDKGIDISQALLDAVKENSMEMVQKLLHYSDTIHSRKSAMRRLYPQQRKSSLGSSQYGEEMTPLMMAAIHGHYELIELLYKRGQRLQELHLPQCNCSLCAVQPKGLTRSNARINLLRAMGSPEYVAFMAGEDKHYDPVHRVFVLTRDIKTCMNQEPEFRNEYQEVLEGVKDFPVEILGMCRNTEEARIFLRNKSGFKGSSSSFPYPRLLVAIDLKQKDFIAHPHCQDVLMQEWEGEQWVTENFSEKSFKFLAYCLVVALYPLISFLLWVTLCCTEKLRAVKWIVRPKNRFMVYCFNYFFYMTILLAVNATEKSDADLGPPHYYTPWIIVFFEISHIISFLTHFLQHPYYFIKRGWNVFELVNHIFWLITFSLWIYLWQVEARGNHFFSNTKIRHDAVPRETLDAMDWTLVAEVTTGIASCMTGLRFLKVFVINKSTGAMLSALGRMSKDLVKFVVFFVVINVSFSLGVHHLYRPYVILSPEHSYTLGNFYTAMENFFWALFTMSDAGAAKLVPVVVQDKPKIENQHFLTESVGKIIYCWYHVLGVTFLMNMITALMSNRYSKITDNVDVEWKFTRSELWLHFIQDSVIAPPFNIIPNGLVLCNLFSWIRILTCTKNPTQKASCSLAGCCYVEAIETEQERKDREHAYPRLIRQLLQRYFRSKMSTASEDPPTKESVIEVRNRVIELRAMTDLLKTQ